MIVEVSLYSISSIRHATYDRKQSRGILSVLAIRGSISNRIEKWYTWDTTKRSYCIGQKGRTDMDQVYLGCCLASETNHQSDSDLTQLLLMVFPVQAPMQPSAQIYRQTRTIQHGHTSPHQKSQTQRFLEVSIGE